MREVPGRRTGWMLLLSLAVPGGKTIELQSEYQTNCSKTKLNVLPVLGMAQLPSNDTYRQVMNNLTINTNLDRWWREMVDGGGAGGEEPKSHAVREVLAKNFVPE
jgi:hypothetical protein